MKAAYVVSLMFMREVSGKVEGMATGTLYISARPGDDLAEEYQAEQEARFAPEGWQLSGRHIFVVTEQQLRLALEETVGSA